MKTVKADVKTLFILTLVHFTGDFYSSFTNPLFPLFVKKLGLSLTQVGMIAGINRFLAFIVQPTVGYLADRRPSRVFILAGLLLTVIFIPLAGMAPGYYLLLSIIALGSIGSSMFHPPVTGMVPVYSGTKTGFAMSIFNTGGTLAFGVGPLFITWYATRFCLETVPFTMLPGLIVTVFIYFTVPTPQPAGAAHLGFWDSLRDSLGGAYKSVAAIWLVMFLRAVVGQSLITFFPVMVVAKGFSLVSAGLIISLYTVAGTVSGLLAGLVADKIGYKPVLVFAFLCMSPVLFLFLKLDGNWVYLGAVVSGALVLAPLPLGVAMAQTLAPKGRSMVASLMMGFAYGLGGLVTPVVGSLADIYSIPAVLSVISLIPLASLPFILALPDVK